MKKPGTKFTAIWTKHDNELYIGTILEYQPNLAGHRCTISKANGTWTNPKWFMPDYMLSHDNMHGIVIKFQEDEIDKEYLELFI